MRACWWCVLGALSMGAAQAQERPFRFELTPYAGYRVSSDLEVEDAETGDEIDLDLDETGSFGLILNIPADYPTGLVNFTVYLKTKTGAYGSFVQIPVLTSQLTVTKGS